MLYLQSDRYANVNTPSGAAKARRVARAAVFLMVFVDANLLAARTEAATYYVSPSGSDANSCADAQSTTQSRQKATIADGLSCLSAGDTLLIHGGTYTGPRNVIDSQSFAVPSGTSWTNLTTIAGVPNEQITLRPPYNVSGIRLTTGSPSYLLFQNFTIDMANSGPGSDADGIFAYTAHHNRFKQLEVKNGWTFGVHFGDDTPFNEVIHCQIHDIGYAGSPSTVGHGLYITASDNLFEGNHVYNNWGYGFHIYNNAGAHRDPSRNVIRGNRVHGNGRHGAPAYGVVIAWGSDNLVYNNLVYGNPGGIQVYTDAANTSVYNNTIYGNSFEGVVLQYYGPRTSVRNNIIFANGSDLSDYGGAEKPTSDHNLLNDPAFVNESAADFTLRDWSIARDAGAPIGVVRDDYAGNPRPSGTTHDVGAFEWGSTPTTPVEPQTQAAPVVSIVSPSNDASWQGSGFFYGSASDTEDGTISSRLTWTSSIDGALGTGASFNKVLSAGRHIITASVTDSGGLAASTQVAVTIASDSPASRTPPTVSIISPISDASWRGSGFFNGSASDTEDGTISSRLTWMSSIDGALGTGASFSKVLSAGRHTITASVTDSGGLTASKQVSVSVTGNTAPTVSIISPINDAAWQGSGFFYGSATDTEDGTISSRLTWTSSIDGALGTGDRFNKVLSAGRHTITASVTDSGGLATSKQIAVTIPGANTAPTVSIISPINDAAWQGSGFFYGSATDTEDGTISSRLTWTSSIDGALGTGASFNKVLSAGRHTITASVTDSGGLATSKQIAVTIPGANTAPTVSIISPINDAAWQGSGFFYGSATDTEDGTISSRLTWTSSIDGALGTGASFNKVLSAGRHTITASVTDSGGLATSKQIAVTIPGANTAPTVSIISPINDAAWQGSGFFYGSATDTEDGTISSRLTWTSSIDGALGAGASFNKVLSVGRHTITASVTDSGGLATSKQIAVTIPPANTAPTVSISSPTSTSYAGGTNITFSGSANDREDGNLTARIVWTSSIDGPLATGALFSRALSAGTHIITATVKDSGGLDTSTQVSVSVTTVNTVPVLSITSPTSTTFAAGTSISFSGSATDSEDGNLTARMVWTSNLSGKIGVGGRFITTLTQGTHLITARITDSAGATAATQVTIAVATPVTPTVPQPTLTGSAYKIRQMQRVDLTWSGVPTSSVDIYRNGSRISTSANDGAWTDVLNNRGGGSYTYKVCGTGTTTCSAEVLVTF